MKAIRLHTQDEQGGLVYEDVPQPEPAEGEALVRIYATGVTPDELSWGTTWTTKDGTKRDRPIPGHELSGLVVQVGAGVSDLKVGQQVSDLVDQGVGWLTAPSGLNFRLSTNTPQPRYCRPYCR